MMHVAYVTFKPDNNVAYGQDFGQWRGVPAGVRFRVEPFGARRWRLTAPGYGTPEAYGNGALYVSLDQKPKAADV